MLSTDLPKFSIYTLIELDFFPWYSIADVLVEHGMPASCELVFVISAKVLVDLLAVFILSKMVFVRKMFGLKD